MLARHLEHVTVADRRRHLTHPLARRTPGDELGPRAVAAARRALALLAGGFAGYAPRRPG
ncbi:hypothetical protein [Nonomuraea sp. B1E8]|uniref:hypothetical protein n=1 Tax=unclassified Nonomuraea TaxID=2593643 RepID=UPI00325F70F6